MRLLGSEFRSDNIIIISNNGNLLRQMQKIHCERKFKQNRLGILLTCAVCGKKK